MELRPWPPMMLRVKFEVACLFFCAGGITGFCDGDGFCAGGNCAFHFAVGLIDGLQVPGFHFDFGSSAPVAALVELPESTCLLNLAG